MAKGDIIRKLANSWKLKLFMIQQLPMGFIAGLRIIDINLESAKVTIPYKYLNKNPFRSTYFAAQSMAAELSTGILAMAAVKDEEKPISMLVLDMNANFVKKATSKIIFYCEDGLAIKNAVQRAANSDSGQIITAKSIGKNNEGIIVSEFEFTWTFKLKT